MLHVGLVLGIVLKTSQAMARRKKVFTTAGMPLLAIVVSANINAVQMLGVITDSDHWIWQFSEGIG